MKVIEFLKPWKRIEFYTRKFNQEEYEFQIDKWVWNNNLMYQSYLDGDIGEKTMKMLESEIIYVKQEIRIPNPEIEIPQITQAIIITIKEN